MYGRVCGGIVGSSQRDFNYTIPLSQWPRIENCWTDIEITGNGSGSRPSGGIFGGEDYYGAYCSVINCYTKGGTGNGQSAGLVAGSINGYVAGNYTVGKTIQTPSNTGAICMAVQLRAMTTDVNPYYGFFAKNMALEGSDRNGNFYRYRDGSTGNPIVVKEGFSTAAQIKAGASTLGHAYVADSENVNGGYPILFWQAGLSQIDLSNATIAAIPAQDYTGKRVYPALTVTLDGTTLDEGTDYFVEYADNIMPGDEATATVFGVGRYTGKLDAVKFTISQVDLSSATIDPVSAQWFYGDPVEPGVVVKDSNGVSLIKGKDYELEYTNNDAEGTATVKVVPASEAQTGSVRANFTIVAAATELEGSGTDEDPYLIGTKGQFQLFSHLVNEGVEGYANATYKVTADLGLTKGEGEPAIDPVGVNNPWVGPVRNGFGGTFDGDGHTITINLNRDDYIYKTNTLNRAGRNQSGLALFSFVCVGYGDNSAYDTDVTFKNFTLKGSVYNSGTGMDPYSGDAAALIAATSYASVVIDSVINEADVTVAASSSYRAAGFIVEMIGGYEIRNSVNKGTIKANGNAAGFVAYRNTTNIAANTDSVLFGSRNEGDISGSNAHVR